MILHVDMDAFFVSVERRADPSLEGRAVIVGGDPGGRGVVCSASYEARAFGVRSAMPMSQARRLCPHAMFVRVGTSDYGAASQEVQRLWRSITPLVEVTSLDEAYLDLAGTERLNGPPLEAADRLISRTWKELRLPCSIGLAENKMLAKVASDCGKPRGLFWICPGGGAAILAPLPLRRLPGIGPKTEERLKRYGLQTLGDLVALGRDTLVQTMGEGGAWLFDRARGIDDTPLRVAEPARSISRETTFESDTEDPERLAAELSWLSERLAAALRAEKVSARTLTLKLRYSDFQTLTRSTTLPFGVHDDRTIYREMMRLLRSAHTRRVRVRLLGVGGTNLSDAQWQLDLFEADKQVRGARLGEAMDAIRRRHGSGSIARARSRLA